MQGTVAYLVQRSDKVDLELQHRAFSFTCSICGNRPLVSIRRHHALCICQRAFTDSFRRCCCLHSHRLQMLHFRRRASQEHSERFFQLPCVFCVQCRSCTSAPAVQAPTKNKTNIKPHCTKIAAKVTAASTNSQILRQIFRALSIQKVLKSEKNTSK